MFETKPDYKKIVLLKFLNQDDSDLSKECAFLTSDNNPLYEELKNILLEQNEEFLN